MSLRVPSESILMVDMIPSQFVRLFLLSYQDRLLLDGLYNSRVGVQRCFCFVENPINTAFCDKPEGKTKSLLCEGERFTEIE